MLFQNRDDGFHRKTLKSYLENVSSQTKEKFKHFYAFIIEKEGKFDLEEWWVVVDRPYSLRIYGEIISKNPTAGTDPMSKNLRHYSYQDIVFDVTPCRNV